LVVWQDMQSDYDIHAQQVSQTGDLVGGEIFVSTWEHDQIKPMLACAEKCLVVWEDHHWAWGDARDIYFQLYKLNSSGFLQADGGNLPIGGDEYRVTPVVYYRDCADDYVVTWEYKTETDNLGIYQRIVLPDGTLLGDETAIIHEAHDEVHPTTATRVSCRSLLLWEDNRNSASTGIDIYGEPENVCSIHCHCPQNQFCYRGKCVLDETPVFCCARSGCPPGYWCVNIEGVRSRCPEDPNYFCQTACDCGPAHCCKDNMCVKDIDVFPVLAQQSMRELTQTERTYREVIDCASWAVFQEGYTEGFGADGDHLKTLNDIQIAVETGMRMITLDMSEALRGEAFNLEQEELEKTTEIPVDVIVLNKIPSIK